MKFKIVIVSYGMFSDDATRVEAQKHPKKVIRFVNTTKSIIVGPAFDNHRYAVTKRGAGKNGYFDLFARHNSNGELRQEVIREYTLGACTK